MGENPTRCNYLPIVDIGGRWTNRKASINESTIVIDVWINWIIHIDLSDLFDIVNWTWVVVYSGSGLCTMNCDLTIAMLTCMC